MKLLKLAILLLQKLEHIKAKGNPELIIEHSDELIGELNLFLLEIEKQKEAMAMQNEEILVKNEELETTNQELISNITDKKKALKIIEESEKRYRLLFLENPQPMWIYDLETLAFLEVNDAAVNHYGYSHEEFLNMNLKDIRPVEDIPFLLEDIEKTRRTLNIAGNWRHIKKNGELIFVEICSHTINYKGKAARHVMAIDITQRKKAEEELLEMNKFIQTVLDNLPIGIALNKFNEGDATYINRKFEEIYGWPAEELTNVDQFFLKVYPDKEYRHYLIKKIMDDINSKDPNKMKWENIQVTAKDGTKKIIDAVNIPLFEQNVMVSTVMDVTAIRKAEKELKEHRKNLEQLVKHRTKELEDKNEQLDRMNQLFVGREFRIKELKSMVKILEQKINSGNLT